MTYQLSDNGLKAVLAIAAVATLWVQSHYQHEDKMKLEREAIIDNANELKAVRAEVKAASRPPLVYGAKQ